MSTWKIMKAIMGVQAIWIAIVGVSIFGYALHATKDPKNKQKKTKNGFQTEKMEEIYNHYKQKSKV